MPAIVLTARGAWAERVEGIDAGADDCLPKPFRSEALIARVGAVALRAPRARDRDPADAGGCIRFTSSILPPYLRRAKSVEELLAWLYPKGNSMADAHPIV